MLDYSNAIDPILHALADPARRGIVEQLAGGPAAVSAIAGKLPMSLQATMQHLAILERAGVVKSEKIGRVRTVTLVTASMRQLERWAADQRVDWERKLDRLDDIITEMDFEEGTNS